MKISDTPEEDSVSNPDIPTASLSAEVLSRKPFANVTDQMQPILYTIHETSADFDEEEASMAESGVTQVELTKQIDIEAELSNMKIEINYVGITTDIVVANMEIGGNDEQPDIDIGLGSVPEYTKYYEPGL